MSGKRPSSALPVDSLPVVIDTAMRIITRDTGADEATLLARVTAAILPLMPTEWPSSYAFEVSKGVSTILIGAQRWRREEGR